MTSQQTMLLAIGSCAAVVLLAGLWGARRSATAEEFHLAGRELGALRAGLSQAASAYGLWVVLGVSGAAYTLGLAAAWIAALADLGSVASDCRTMAPSPSAASASATCPGLRPVTSTRAPAATHALAAESPNPAVPPTMTIVLFSRGGGMTWWGRHSCLPGVRWSRSSCLPGFDGRQECLPPRRAGVVDGWLSIG